MALIPASAERTARRMRANPAAKSGLDPETPGMRRRPRRPSLPTLTADAQATVPAPAGSSDETALDGDALSIDEQIGLLWTELQSQLLKLLGQGVAAPFQQRAFDRLDYSMKQYARLRRERAEEQRSARSAEPGPEELAAILDKIDRRIDALAEDRFKNLVDGKLHPAGENSGGARVDD